VRPVAAQRYSAWNLAAALALATEASEMCGMGPPQTDSIEELANWRSSFLSRSRVVQRKS
jgi:hypothetical protein